MRHKSIRTLVVLVCLAVVLPGLAACMPCGLCAGPSNMWKDFNMNGWGRDGNKGGDTATVKGYCFIDANGEKTPVPDQKVEIGSHEIYCDDDGYFELSGIKPGKYRVRVSGGDLGWTGTIYLEPGETEDMGDVYLHPTLPLP